MKKVLVALVVVVVAVAVIVGARLRDGEQGVEVDVEEVVRRDISRIVKASGEIDPRVKVNLSAHLIGRIEKLHVEEGDRIEAGRPVLELEREAFVAQRDDWRARLRKAETEVRQAEVDLADAELKLERTRRLAAEGIVSLEHREAAELARTSAELRLEQARDSVVQARANLAKAVDDLAKTTIYAPLSGRVIALYAEEGEVVVSGTMNNQASIIATIADLSEILAEVDVDETEIAYVQIGQPAQLAVDAVPDRSYRGRVVELGSSGFKRAQQRDVTYFKVKILLEDPDEALRPGMSVRARIVAATRRQVPVVPIQAVVERPPPVAEEASATGDDEVPVVFAVADGRAEQRPVTTGISDETHVEVTSGLEPGRRVVVGPYRTLRDLEHDDPVRLKAPEDGS